MEVVLWAVKTYIVKWLNFGIISAPSEELIVIVIVRVWNNVWECYMVYTGFVVIYIDTLWSFNSAQIRER